MNDNTESLVLRHLQALRAGQDDLPTGQGEIREELSRINLRLSVIEDQGAQMLTLGASDRAELDRLKKRVERIERRLELLDD